MRYFYGSIERWEAIDGAGCLEPTDLLSNDPELSLSDDTRVRISVRMRRDNRKFCAIYAGSWLAVVDRVDDLIEWERPMLICGPSRSMVLGATGMS